ncbi:hypothetical protein BH09VER1_BH09VER1_27920 [soil metagenome]
MTICRNHPPAFSLIELLTVLAIIALMAVLSAPAINQMLRATKLTTSGQAVIDELNLARQTALSKNACVEVRFYRLPEDSADPSSAPAYRAQQSFLVQDSGTNPLGKPTLLSYPVIFSTNGPESGFFSSTYHLEQAAPTGATLPTFGTNYRYRSFRFSAGGSPDLQNSENYLTLVLKNDKALSAGANFFTVQVSPISGSIRSFRP